MFNCLRFSADRCVKHFRIRTPLCCNQSENEDRVHLLCIFPQKEWAESLGMSSELITADVAVRANVFVRVKV